MKLDILDDGIHLLMKMIYVNEYNHTNIHHQQISFYLKDNVLITFQEKHTPFFLPIKQRLEHSRGRLAKLRSDYLFCSLVDIIIENYMVVLRLIGLKIEHIETELMQMKSLKLDTLQLIYKIRHDMLHFRIICSPLKEIAIKLQKAYDRLPRRDPFTAQRRGPKPLKKKRGRRATQRPPTSILQPIKSRGRSVSPIQTDILQPIKSRGRSVSPTRTDMIRRRKSRQSFSYNDDVILHEYMFPYLKNLHVHILELNGTIETYSEMISWLVNFYMALNENTVTQAVRLLAMLQAIHYPLLFVHGLNSVNFDYVPQLNDCYNCYFVFLSIMVLIVVIGLTTFKIKKWL
jgi:Mg2+ and Co2+ transporter CorA